MVSNFTKGIFVIAALVFVGVSFTSAGIVTAISLALGVLLGGFIVLLISRSGFADVDDEQMQTEDEINLIYEFDRYR